LGVGEGHLFHHRKARRLVSGDFAKLGSLFQSFLKCATQQTLQGKIRGNVHQPDQQQALEYVVHDHFQRNLFIDHQITSACVVEYQGLHRQ
ncbi:hypothetical protein, partial [Pseudomonas syringae]|uniref:hypothetical protein n=1 Tax=Pseudomonas syringae TaxID=317 RepID=UPI001C5573C3